MKKLSLFLFFIFSFSFSYSQYILYGVTGGGGAYYDPNEPAKYGTIFSYNPLTKKQTILFSFNGTNGFGPVSKLLYVPDSLVYGTTAQGGVNGMGTVFSFNLKTNTENVVINYDSTNGYTNDGDNQLMQAKNGLIYGTSWQGGKYGGGVIYNYDIHTGKDSVQYNLVDTVTGWGSFMELWEDTASGILYGVTEGGGKFGNGVLYGFNPKTNKDSVYVSFNNSPNEPTSGLIKANNGLLYGTSQAGGKADSGAIYTFNTQTGSVNVVYSFGGKYGAYPNTNELLQLSNGLLYGMTYGGGDAARDGVLFSFNPANNTEKVLVTFNGTDGSNSYGSLVQDPDNGLLYGTTSNGGSAGYGVLFSYDITTNIYTKLLDFTGPNGAYPVGSLTLVDTAIHLGVNSIHAPQGSVKAYPNPGRGVFTLQISNYEPGTRNIIEIYDVLGEKVYAGSVNSTTTEINLSNQPAGVYFYRVLTQEGSLAGEGKLGVER